MIKQQLILLMFLLGIIDINAQQAHVNLDWAPQRNNEGLTPFMANTISPEVYDDHTVTFRVKAPEASEVFLSGSILLGLNAEKPVPFMKGEDGLWSLTVGPMTPEIYYYKLVIDGVSVVDPANALVGFAGQPGFSILVVHGEGPAWYDAKNVPHGAVTRHIYHSDVTGGERELFVYTPPGYSPSKKYPVLYLVGGSGELASTWSMFGRVNFIEDNLIAEGKALPMIIAMPNNQMVHRMDPKHTEKSFSMFNDEMLNEVIPFVEKNYSVKADKHNRAISGLSMGGRHAQIIGMNNLDVFGSIGILSGAESFGLMPEVLDDPDLNNKIDYLFVGAGTHETTPRSRHALLHQELEKRNIKHEYYIGGDGAHDFVTWRHLLYHKFLPTLWKEN
ncbi:MAG: esterase [Prolixibacteraceae bacterium]|nr:esterase [Prolixibacteraceae bacterium]